MADTGLDDWFVQEVLPLEGRLVGYLRRNWRDASEIDDLRQEVYLRAYDAAARGRPTATKGFVFSIARNLLIDRARRLRIVPITAVAGFDDFDVASDQPTPEAALDSRQQQRQLQTAIDRLPPRCRQALILHKIEGLSHREVARRMGIAEHTVERHVMKGVRALAGHLIEFGFALKLRRSVAAACADRRPLVLDAAGPEPTPAKWGAPKR